jgi:ABC-type polar amino acid transport system ATPase subunit
MIELRDVTKRFGSNEVLRGVNLAVAKGEVAVLLGPSGSGKSTLLRTINGLETFDQGSIMVDGTILGPETDATRDQALAEIRRKVGMVFQQFNLFPHLTALENVIEAPVHVLKTPIAEARDQAAALLKRVGLADKANARPSQLSGGQQQRVAIARTLAMHPEVILFDEPTSALDPRMTAEVIAVMTDLAQSGQTMLVVTHAMGFARSVANIVHVLDHGSIAESGSPEQIFESPKNPSTRELLAQTEQAKPSANT